MPDQEMRKSSSKHASLSMSCSELKASKRERPCLSAAADMGACMPVKTSIDVGQHAPPLSYARLQDRSRAIKHALQAGLWCDLDRQCRVLPAVGPHCPEERPERPPDCFRCGWQDAARPHALAGSLLWRKHARTGSCLFCTGPVGICGRLACLDALPPNCRVSSPSLFLSPFFGVVPPYAAWGLGVCQIVLD